MAERIVTPVHQNDGGTALSFNMGRRRPMPAPDIDTVWARISANARSEFRMIEGATFRYKIAG